MTSTNLPNLITNTGFQIRGFEINGDGPKLLNSSILIYGMRKTGKTTLIKALMNACKPYISFYYVISKSALYNGDYGDMVPGHAIYESVDIEWMEELVKSQKERAHYYKIANNIVYLQAVFNQISNLDPRRRFQTMKSLYTDGLARIERMRSNGQITEEKYNAQRKDMAKIFDEKCLLLYKQQIQVHMQELWEKYTKAAQDEAPWPMEWEIVVRYNDFVPHLFIVFDDCSAEIRKWAGKMKSFREIFFNGRHINITIVITGHTITSILPDLRNNATFSFFTSPNVVGPHFKCEEYSKEEYKHAIDCAEKIFREKSRHYKMIYYPEDPESPFRYVNPKVMDYGRVGCDAQWKLDEMIRNNQVP